MKRFLKKYIDLTHCLSSSISCYPGSIQPQIKPLATFETEGYSELLLHIGTHHGTHVDAPAHFIPNSTFLDEFKPEQFIGKGAVIDLQQNEEQITKEINELTNVEYVLFWTGWDQYWNSNLYHSKFPVINEKMANILTKKGIKGIGIDTLSVDCITSTSFPIHKILLESNIILIENLTNLHQLKKQKFDVMCFPMKILNSDGGPARVIAILDENE